MKKLLIILLFFGLSLYAFDQIDHAKNCENIMIIETDYGEIEIALFRKKAPKNVNSIIGLVEDDFYNGTTFHRIIPNFVVQGGDPNTKDDDPTNDGMGGPDYVVEDEFDEDLKHLKGTVAMAKARPDENGSQFYICLKRLSALDGKYTIVGQVINGMDNVDEIAKVKTDKNDRPLENVMMKDVYMKKDSVETSEEKK